MSIELVGHEVGPIGFGLMGFTWRPTSTPDEQAFATMKRAIELGANFFNSGEFYGQPVPTLNLDLINRFFTKYPEYADKVVLSVKGGLDNKTLVPDGSPEGIRRSVMNILSHLGGVKKLDLFECARVDPKVPIETSVAAMAELVKEGLISGISLSEVKAETIRRAAKVATIAAVEIEFSLWSLEAREIKVLETCAELGILVIAYSPLGKGFLTGQVRSRADLPEGDLRLHMDRFSEENLPINLELVDEVVELAAKKGVTPAQMAISWIKKHEETIPGLKIIPIPGSTTVSKVEENTKQISPMSDEDFEELETTLRKFEVKGGRYFARAEPFLWS
ncbi:NADP-dependent oxidoreductase domain-containing protein [Lipomyces arxii]|uniref:NADP-dependent oxidoreductase domain-containing protein n=1 Tax=Lipomyces arxii TaxID=56418 RepID=UPI0034CE7547